MKCRSVACIWPETPPSHKVTTSASLHHPPTLYTGGSDGSIIWWNLFSSSSSSSAAAAAASPVEIKAVAMLCGHAAPIADLDICYPVEVVGHDDDEEEEEEDEDDVDVDDGNEKQKDSPRDGALISACTDGVLCVWSRRSGNCRRRRKLAPWVGTPSIVHTLPSSPRYVCVGCCFTDAKSSLDHHSVDVGRVPVNWESLHRKSNKCTVVIVDTYSLTIVQTVFHGSLSIGPLKFMDVVFSGEDGERHSVYMADSFGKVQLVPLLKDSSVEIECGDGLHKDAQLEEATRGNGFSEGEEVVSITTCGNLIAMLLSKSCIFRLLTSETTVGEICFVDNLLRVEGELTKVHLSGCMFIGRSYPGDMQHLQEASEDVFGKFCVWNSAGSAIVYSLSYLSNIFQCEPICEVPAVSNPVDQMALTSFVRVNAYLLRIESICCDLEEPSKWKPHITVWNLCQMPGNNEKLPQKCKILGETQYFVDWISSSYLLNDIDGHGNQRTSFCEDCVSHLENKNNKYPHAHHRSAQKKHTVSSSMVISEKLIIPYAVVYGFVSGEIEVIRFDLFLGPDSPAVSPRLNIDSPVSRQYFLGHTGAVLCLAAHRMLGSANGQPFIRVLVSGSMDCTVRIWDVDTGSIITVMHQHVAPVRQVIFPPIQTEHPWNDCFLSVGEDSCVALASLETLRVERMFPGHPGYPEKVAWDGARGYIGCLCKSDSGTSDVIDVLFIWDVKTGSLERVLRRTAAHSMFDHFCKGISVNSITGSVLNGNTSVSSLLLPIIEEGNFSQSHITYSDKRVVSLNMGSSAVNLMGPSTSQALAKEVDSANALRTTQLFLQGCSYPIRCTCPFPGIASLSFDLSSLMCSYQKLESNVASRDKLDSNKGNEQESNTHSPRNASDDNGSYQNGMSAAIEKEHDWNRLLEEHLLCFSLSFLHTWNLDSELDKLLIADLNLRRPKNCLVASGLQGDKGSLTLTFPTPGAFFELWKSSSEFCAMRSLTVVSIAQRMISLSHSGSSASSALAAFYTRNFADKIPDLRAPSLQILVSFWQHESEHVRMAARTLFHCAASRAIPLPLCSAKANEHVKLVRSLSGIGQNGPHNVQETSANGSAYSIPSEPTSRKGKSSDKLPEGQDISQAEESKVLSWLQSFEVQDWISCIGGTSQDAMTSNIIVAAALAVWYPSLVKSSLAMLVIHPLIKLVMAMNDKYSSTAAELLAEGMENTWRACCSSEIPRLISDILFQIECVSNPSANSAGHRPAVASSIRVTLVEVLLPSLAMADILGFLAVIESQIWSTASDSPIHLVSLATIARIVHGSPRYLAPFLDKVVNYILHTMDPANLVMRKTCLQSSMTVLKEVVRVFPMVALNEAGTRLAVGDAIGQINDAGISVYDMQSPFGAKELRLSTFFKLSRHPDLEYSVAKIKVLDASGPPGLPTLLSSSSEMAVTTLVSALSFSPDGEGLVAFSEHGLMIRWWSLGSVWWEKLSRNFVPVQCTKLIFVPPWEGFSPNSSRSSVMASIAGHDRRVDLQEHSKSLSYADSLKLLIHNLDLAYRLEWAGVRKVLLTRHSQELSTFPL